ncbi:TetR/AcrR family transcriptional regulator [Streptomyces sp. CB02400]|uniref:TetR/AcrR family transcriptional regulator n=1 Tax=unclassified Streptomyces TaxID=2593676 RepID=UPI000AB74208|nr:TetR/AcrR family transcriptional regulator [Streptomyces sp. CB02400]
MKTRSEAAVAQEPTDRPKRRRRSTGTYAAADARRTAILDAATAGFARGGYLNSSLARIAADAGTSATVVLHHFGSKEKLLMAVLEAREERNYLKVHGSVPHDDVREQFRAVLALATHNLTEPGLIELFAKLSVEATDPAHPAHAFFTTRYEGAARALATGLRGALAAGRLRPGTDPDQVAREVLAVSDGLQVQWALSQGRLDFVADYRAYLDRLARSLTTDGRGLD